MFEVRDEYEEPRTIQYDAILQAKRRLTGLVIRTPCTVAHMSAKYGLNLYYKLELAHLTGSCKDRAVCNLLCMLSEEQKKIGVVSASNGNLGVAMAYLTTKLGIPCYVVMTTIASCTKVFKCREFIGNRCIVKGSTTSLAVEHARLLAKEKKMIFLDGFNEPSIIEGHGTCALEIMDQVPSVDAILVPVGSGTLLAGISIYVNHFSPNVQVYGVSSTKTIAMAEALRKNRVVPVLMESSVADGLAIDKASVNALHNIKNKVKKLIMVSEEWMMRAVTHLLEEEKYCVEGGSAICVAAIMAGLLPELRNKTVVCCLTGGNISFGQLSRCVERSLSCDGRLVKIKVTLSEERDSLAKFTNLLNDLGIRIHDIITERTSVKGSLHMELKLVVETNSRKHIEELREIMQKNHIIFQLEDHITKEPNIPVTRRGPCLAPNPVCMQN